MVALLPGWSSRWVVVVLEALRGVALLSAITLMGEIGDFRRWMCWCRKAAMKVRVFRAGVAPWPADARHAVPSRAEGSCWFWSTSRR